MMTHSVNMDFGAKQKCLSFCSSNTTPSSLNCVTHTALKAKPPTRSNVLIFVDFSDLCCESQVTGDVRENPSESRSAARLISHLLRPAEVHAFVRTNRSCQQ